MTPLPSPLGIMAGTRAGARKGWETRRANAQAVEAARAKPPRPGVPPGAGRVRPTRDGAVVWAAPRDPDGRVEPQAALGVGSVSDDLIGRRGAFVSRGGIRSGLEKVQGLRTLTITYRIGLDTDDMEGEDGDVIPGEGSRTVRRRVTVDFGKAKSPRERELAIARAVQDHARALIRDDSSQVVRITLVRIGEPLQLSESKRPDRSKPKRKPKGKPGAKVKAYRKAQGAKRGAATRKANAQAKAKAKSRAKPKPKAQAKPTRKAKPTPKAKAKPRTRK